MIYSESFINCLRVWCLQHDVKESEYQGILHKLETDEVPTKSQIKLLSRFYKDFHKSLSKEFC